MSTTKRTNLHLKKWAFIFSLATLLAVTVGCEDDDEIGDNTIEPIEERGVASNDEFDDDLGEDEEIMDDEDDLDNTYASSERQLNGQDIASSASSSNNRKTRQAGNNSTATGGSGMAFPIRGASGNLKIDRQGGNEVRVGEPYQYQLVVSNNSDKPVNNVVLKESLPRSFQIMEADPRMEQANPQMSGSMDMRGSMQSQRQRSGADSDRNRQNRDRNQAPPGQRNQRDQQGQQQRSASMLDHTWRLGTLQPDESRTVKVVGVAQSEGSLQSCLALTYEPSYCTQLNVIAPELKLTQEITPQGEPIYACDEVTITYRLTNEGTGTTDAATINARLPQGMRTADGQSEVSIDAGELEAGQTVEKTVTLQPQSRGEYSASGSASTGELQVRSSQDSIRVLKPELNLRVDGAGTEYLDRSISYQITVENTSQDPALETQVRINRPENTTRWTFSSQEVQREDNVFKIGRLEGGQSRTFEVSFEGTEPGRIYTEAVASAYCAEEVSKEITTEVAGIAAIRLETIDLTDPVEVGQNTTYEIQVKNQGSAKDLNVKVSAELPQQLTFVEGQGDTSVNNQGQRVNFGPIDELGPGELASWKVTAKAQEPGDVRLKLQMQSDANQKPVLEEEPTTLY